MSVLEDRQNADQRYRRQRNLLIIRAILYLISIVPAILIASNFEAFRYRAIRILQGGQHTQRADQPVAPPQPQAALTHCACR